MSGAEGLHPGAVWHKCDFQCHTPRDRGWEGSPHLPGGSAEAEAARQAWAEEFIKAAEQAGLTAVAVTDHHDICLSEYVKATATRLDSRVKVYPGIEITCSDDSQCLVIFDPAASLEQQKLALAAAGDIMMASSDDEIGVEVKPARNTIADFFSAVASERNLRDACVLLPHFSAEDAYKSLNKPHHHPRFSNLPCDGVYIERPYSSLDETTIAKIEGKVEEWGKRRRAVLATGDNRKADWSRLGVHDCWIKLGEYSAEAVRQALLADEARIIFEAPACPPERLVLLRVKSTLTGPLVFSVAFNDGFTAIIGGRGSGKSVLLEYLRFGLGRTERDMRSSAAQFAYPREVQLIDETLTGDGFVEVVLEREGVRETWRRTTSQDGIEIQRGDESIVMTPSMARERFRARAFRQKGLSSTMNDAATAAEQITGIAAAEELDKQREVDQAIRNAKRNVTTALQNLAAYIQARLEHQQSRERTSDIRERLGAIAERLAAEGVAPDDIKTLEQAPVHARARSYLDAAKRTIDEEAEAVGEFQTQILPISLGDLEGVSAFEEIAELQASIDKIRSEVAGKIGEAFALVETLRDAHSQAEVAYKARREAFNDAHAKAIAEQTRHRNLMEDSQRLGAELQTAERAQARAAASEAEKASAIAAYADATAALDTLLEERREILKIAADKVAGKSSDLLKARVKRDRMPDEYVTALCALFEATHTQGVTEKCQGWVSDVLGDGGIGWNELRKKIVWLYESKIAAGSPAEPSEETAKGIDELVFGGSAALTINQRRRFYANLSDATVGQIVSAVPKDSIVLTYMDRGRPIDFAIASPGQQASALLELLLSQSAGTLVIDQPEDDLDNRVIMRIVELIRTSKSHRQLVFTTHNPNIVVNGDADKILALKSLEPSSSPADQSPRVQIDTDGAIETTTVREAITTVMEGGKEAFDLRSRKYRYDVISGMVWVPFGGVVQ